ncbi:MAG: hypothetical protein QS721_06730 [Candidatus Endonucleobacter sp. (ex Gigantidas childressi)]|nr:hypothetical protein [Candidatus Endonucleobacter sp. (ex Gigantidas childressi)]
MKDVEEIMKNDHQLLLSVNGMHHFCKNLDTLAMSEEAGGLLIDLEDTLNPEHDKEKTPKGESGNQLTVGKKRWSS